MEQAKSFIEEVRNLLTDKSDWETTGKNVEKLYEFYSKPFHPEMLAHLIETPNFLNYGDKLTELFNKDTNMWKKSEEEPMILFDGWEVNETDGFNYAFTKKGLDMFYHIGYYKEESAYTIHSYSEDYEYHNKPATLDNFIVDCQKAGVKLFWNKPDQLKELLLSNKK